MKFLSWIRSTAVMEAYFPRKALAMCVCVCGGGGLFALGGVSSSTKAGLQVSSAKFPQRSVITCSMQISCCRGRTLQTRPQTGGCEPLMPDVVVPKAHQNNCSYVSLADLLFGFTMEEFSLAWWAVTRGTLKNHKTGGGHLCRCGFLPGTIQYIYSYTCPNSL